MTHDKRTTKKRRDDELVRGITYGLAFMIGTLWAVVIFALAFAVGSAINTGGAP